MKPQTRHDIIQLEGGPLNGERVELPGLEPGEEYQARRMMPGENASYQATGRFKNYQRRFKNSQRERWIPDLQRRGRMRSKRVGLLIPLYRWAGWVKAE